MSWFSYQNDGPIFELFGLSHLFIFILLILICLAIVLKARRVSDFPQIEKGLRYSLVIFLVALEGSYHFWLLIHGEWSIAYALPLHLSSITLITAALMLVFGKQRLFEFTFFAGVGSATLTLITPDIGGYDFPHYRYFHFFMSHAFVIVSVIYMIAVKKYKVTFRSIFPNWLWLNAYAAIVFVVNLIVDGNYMYLMRKPPGPSPFDWFGPWPYYIFVLQLVALGLFMLMYGIYRILVKEK
ncbi:TIGR02206 family membrane protein [Alkalihalobacillus sp. 1P02AB]|uniref:YwaF family protein n=1 Tax=Alkalihalobacillus sp. 1P02AB TaxID=3132260 RepID=UPI0039A718B6